MHVIIPWSINIFFSKLKNTHKRHKISYSRSNKSPKSINSYSFLIRKVPPPHPNTQSKAPAIRGIINYCELFHI